MDRNSYRRSFQVGGHACEWSTGLQLPIIHRPKNKWKGSTEQSSHASNTALQSIRPTFTSMCNLWYARMQRRYTNRRGRHNAAWYYLVSHLVQPLQPSQRYTRRNDETTSPAKFLQSIYAPDGRHTKANERKTCDCPGKLRVQFRQNCPMHAGIILCTTRLG